MIETHAWLQNFFTILRSWKTPIKSLSQYVMMNCQHRSWIFRKQISVKMVIWFFFFFYVKKIIIIIVLNNTAQQCWFTSPLLLVLCIYLFIFFTFVSIHNKFPIYLMAYKQWFDDWLLLELSSDQILCFIRNIRQDCPIKPNKEGWSLFSKSWNRRTKRKRQAN